MFSRICNSVAPNVIDKISKHKFNVQLFDGSLSAATFNYYLEQDIIYLGAFHDALLAVKKKLNKVTHIEKFSDLARDVKNFELDLHKEYLQKNTGVIFFSKPKMPVIEKYVLHLQKCAEQDNMAVAVASLVPCYWLYSALGQHPNLMSNETNPYHYWVKTYSDPLFIAAANSIIAVLDELSNAIDCLKVKADIESAFKTSVDYEIQFWDDVCARLEPVVALVEEPLRRLSGSHK